MYSHLTSSYPPIHHIASHKRISHHIKSPRIALLRITHLHSPYTYFIDNISHLIPSHHLCNALHHKTSYPITSHRITHPPITSHHITSHRITSHRITYPHIYNFISHRIASLFHSVPSESSFLHNLLCFSILFAAYWQQCGWLVMLSRTTTC
jgi:hypothetical protein